jgi:hypothetical protein
MFMMSSFGGTADAHMYFSFPSADIPGSEMADVFTTFALNPPMPDESGEDATKYEIEGWVVSSNNPEVSTPVSFEFTDDSMRSRVSVPDSATSVFVTSADYANDESYEGVTYHQEFACFSKAFINLGEDGFSTRTFMRSGLEIVPLSDLAGVSPSSRTGVKILKDGQPLAGVDVYVTQEGAPFTDLHDEVTALRAERTGNDGTAIFVMPSSPGKTYFYTMYLDSRTTGAGFYGMMSSLSFEISDPFGADATDLLVSDGDGGTNMEFVGANTYASMRDYLFMIGALDLVSQPTGSILRVSGKSGQIGDMGASFKIPMDVTGAKNVDGTPIKGVTGTEQRVNFSRELLGEAVFDRMVSFLRNVKEQKEANKQYELTERGEFYVAPTPKDFLERFGISVMGSFSGGEAVDVGDMLQLGIELNDAEFDRGNIYGLLGGMFADSGPVEGRYWYDATEMFVGPDPHYIFAIVYDGNFDNTLDFAYWVVRAQGGDEEEEDRENSGSGGCSNGASVPMLIAAALVRMRVMAGRKRT